jgi:hypothetical protein
MVFNTERLYTQHFQDRWFQLRNEGDIADFQIICDGCVFWVHESVLASSNSDYFRALFNSEWKETAQRSITVPAGISRDAVYYFIGFLYTGVIYFEKQEHLFSSFELSDYFQCPVMRDAYLREIKDSISLDNVQILVEQWNNNKNDAMEEILAQFIADNFQELSTKKFPFHQLGEMVNKIMELISGRMSALESEKAPVCYPGCYHCCHSYQCGHCYPPFGRHYFE